MSTLLDVESYDNDRLMMYRNRHHCQHQQQQQHSIRTSYHDDDDDTNNHTKETTVSTSFIRRRKSTYTLNVTDSESMNHTSSSSSSSSSPTSSLCALVVTGTTSIDETVSSSSSSSSSTSERNDGSSTLNQSPVSLQLQEQSTRSFVSDIRQLIHDHYYNNNNNSQGLNLCTPMARKVMEPYLRQARLLREQARNQMMMIVTSGEGQEVITNSHHNSLSISIPIASSMNVPYIPLRQRSSFLYDITTYPLHTVLAQTLCGNESNISLSQLHHYRNSTNTVENDNINQNDTILLPLHDRSKRYEFQLLYDNFVTLFCIPLLHSMAISKHVIHFSSFSTTDTTTTNICYRYQTFPHIHIVYPKNHSSTNSNIYTEPTCDLSLGYSIGCITFYIPLTPSSSSTSSSSINDLYVESYPGKEDWYPLVSSSSNIGLGYIFDGTRCLHFDINYNHNETSTTTTTSSPPTTTGSSTPNDNDTTRVAIMFRVLIYRDENNNTNTNNTNSSNNTTNTNNNTNNINASSSSGDVLCPIHLINDKFSNDNSNYYDEVYIDLCSNNNTIVHKKNNNNNNRQQNNNSKNNNTSPVLLDPSPLMGYPFDLK